MEHKIKYNFQENSQEYKIEIDTNNSMVYIANFFNETESFEFSSFEKINRVPQKLVNISEFDDCRKIYFDVKNRIKNIKAKDAPKETGIFSLLLDLILNGILELKPNICGLGVNLNEAIRLHFKKRKK